MCSKGDKDIINRLCSEIQLFDLCDLDCCNFKKDRFCTNKELLTGFESITEEDDRPLLVSDEEELDDPELLDDDDESDMEMNDDE